jgi:hypothetical protein
VGLGFSLPVASPTIRAARQLRSLERLRERSGMKRSYALLAAGVVGVTAILLAALLRHGCGFYPCGRGGPCIVLPLPCSRLDVLARIAVGLDGAAVAGLLLLLGRRTSN